MKIIREDVSHATFNYPEDKQRENFWKKYKVVGESYSAPQSNCWRFKRLVSLVCVATLGIFLCFLPYLSYHYRKNLEIRIKEVKLGKEISLHYLPSESRINESKNEALIIFRYDQKSIENFLKNPYIRMRVLDPFPHPLDDHINDGAKSARLLFKLDFGASTIQKSFLIKNEDGSPLTHGSLLERSRNIFQDIEKEINLSQSVYKKSHVFTFFKDTDGEYHCCTEWHDHSNENSSRSGCGYFHGLTDIKKQRSWMARLGFLDVDLPDNPQFLP